MKGPALPDVGVLGLVVDRWDGLWQPRQHVLTRLADWFQVVWLGHMRDWDVLWRQGRPAHDAAAAGRPGFQIYRQDLWLPVLYRPQHLARLTARGRLERARRLLRRRGVRRTVLYVWRPEFLDALDLVSHDLSVYHLDDEYTFSDHELPIEPREAELLRRVDQVIVHSPALAEKKGHLNPHTALVPNGVDYAAYATPREEPADLRGIPRPRIGYVGRIKPQLDLDLLLELSARHPQWSFVLVGPCVSFAEDERRISALEQRANVHLLGSRPLDALPAYTQHLDVCTMAYALTGYTRFIYPMKLHEYLAAGPPVVASPIRSLRDFADTIALAGSVEEWSAALAAALEPAARSEEAVRARRAVAREHDWNRIARRVAELICERLGGELPERLAAHPAP